MIHLLAKWLIPRCDDVADGAVRRAWGTLCGFVGVGLNLLLFAAKLVAGILSGSIAAIADAFNNLSDAGSSVVTLLGFRLAGKKPDNDHPFGHGRMEYVSGLVVAGLILLMGVELLKTSVERIAHPVEVTFSAAAVAIMLLSLAVKFYMCSYNRSVGRRIGSAAMLATATDSLSDMISTAAVVVSMVLGRFTDLSIDGYVGLLVACFILYAAVQAARETIDPLLGKAPEKEFVQNITTLVMAHPMVRGIHDLVVHDYGPGRLIISLHAEVNAKEDIMELHDVIDNIEQELARELHCEAVIHMDPIDTDDALTTALRCRVAELVLQVHEGITIHDFRLVSGPSHTNLIFDAVVPFDASLSLEETERQIAALVRGMEGGNYFAVVKAEHSYS